MHAVTAPQRNVVMGNSWGQTNRKWRGRRTLKGQSVVFLMVNLLTGSTGNSSMILYCSLYLYSCAGFFWAFMFWQLYWEYASRSHSLYFKEKCRKDIPEISDETFLFAQLLSSPSNCLMKARRACNIWRFSSSKAYPTPLNLHHSFQICS